MGKKPVLGMVSALCVGLALTGCDHGNTRSDGPALTKATTGTYKTPPAFGQASAAPASQTQGWNTQPTTVSKPGTMTSGAAMTEAPPAPSSRMGSSGVQTAGAAIASSPPPAPAPAAAPAATDTALPSSPRPMDQPATSVEDKKYPFASSSSGRVLLPPTPPLSGVRELPPVGQGMTPVANKVEDEAPPVPVPPPPLPSGMPTHQLPGDAPAPPPAAAPAPVSADPPAAAPTPPLPPLPPVPGTGGPNG